MDMDDDRALTYLQIRRKSCAQESLHVECGLCPACQGSAIGREPVVHCSRRITFRHWV